MSMKRFKAAVIGGSGSGGAELIRRLRRSVIARQRVQVFKPIIDDRFATDEVVSRDERRLKAHAVATSAQLLARVEIGVQVVGIDEVQFFDAGVVDVCMQLADAGIRVIAAGLDQDYMRRPFGPMPAPVANNRCDPHRGATPDIDGASRALAMLHISFAIIAWKASGLLR